MEVRIGIVQSVKELTLELETDKARSAFRTAVQSALAGKTDALTITDDKGKEILVPADKIAYVEFGAGDSARRLGFGA